MRVPAYVLFFLFSGCLFAKNKTYHYEPESVELVGIIDRQTFAGPPNYESIKQGDLIETGRYLRLEEPIDIEASNKDQIVNSENEKNVKIIQLTFMDDDLWNKLKPGKRLKIKGSLFHAFTGHHHARVLLSVDLVQEATK